jgi:hypothetical protein
MRMLDEDNDRRLSHVTLFLTKAEVIELQGCLTSLLLEPPLHHEHLSMRDTRKR